MRIISWRERARDRVISGNYERRREFDIYVWEERPTCDPNNEISIRIKIEMGAINIRKRSNDRFLHKLRVFQRLCFYFHLFFYFFGGVVWFPADCIETELCFGQIAFNILHVLPTGTVGCFIGSGLRLPAIVQPICQFAIYFYLIIDLGVRRYCNFTRSLVNFNDADAMFACIRSCTFLLISHPLLLYERSAHLFLIIFSFWFRAKKKTERSTSSFNYETWKQTKKIACDRHSGDNIDSIKYVIGFELTQICSRNLFYKKFCLLKIKRT